MIYGAGALSTHSFKGQEGCLSAQHDIGCIRRVSNTFHMQRAFIMMAMTVPMWLSTDKVISCQC